MNILLICDEYPPCQHGGIGTVTQNLARELVVQGHAVVVCGFYPYYRVGKSYEEDHGVKIYRRFYGNYLKLKLSRHKFLGQFINIKTEFNNYTEFLNSLIKHHSVGIIELPDFNEAFRYSGPKFIRYPQFTVPTIVKLHGNYSMVAHLQKARYDPYIYAKEQFHITQADAVISVSRYMKQLCIDIFDLKKEIKVIHNGIHTNNNKTLQIAGNKKPVVVYAGRINKEKGALNLLKAWPLVKKQVPEARLELYGQIENSSEPEIRGLVDASVSLKGFINKAELMEKYQQAACAVFPSYFETFGMAVIEAMSVGCPVIYTKNAAGPEIVTDQHDGCLVDPGNAQEIADAILLLLINRIFAEKIAANGLKKVQTEFSIGHTARQHFNQYLTTIKN